MYTFKVFRTHARGYRIESLHKMPSPPSKTLPSNRGIKVQATIMQTIGESCQIVEWTSLAWGIMGSFMKEMTSEWHFKGMVGIKQVKEDSEQR